MARMADSGVIDQNVNVILPCPFTIYVIQNIKFDQLDVLFMIRVHQIFFKPGYLLPSMNGSDNPVALFCKPYAVPFPSPEPAPVISTVCFFISKF